MSDDITWEEHPIGDTARTAYDWMRRFGVVQQSTPVPHRMYSQDKWQRFFEDQQEKRFSAITRDYLRKALADLDAASK